MINPSGSKWWRSKYRFAGKEQLLTLGAYPDVSLKSAPLSRCRHLKVAAGTNPMEERHARRRGIAVATENTFEAIAVEFLSRLAAKLAPITLEKARWMLQTFAFPDLGSLRIETITPAQILRTLQKVESRGRIETAHRTRSRISQVFRCAAATGRAKRDPTVDLRVR